jgi:DNA-binding response OmpR family regulator
MDIQKSIKVLIVDDEPNVLLSLEFLMKKEGFIVFIARDGEEAFDIIKREHPKIVFLDTMMPKVDGYAVCKFIKGNNDTKETKVVFLNTKSKEKDTDNTYSVGADLYIPKPFSIRDLAKKVNMMAAEVIK